MSEKRIKQVIFSVFISVFLVVSTLIFLFFSPSPVKNKIESALPPIFRNLIATTTKIQQERLIIEDNSSNFIVKANYIDDSFFEYFQQIAPNIINSSSTQIVINFTDIKMKDSITDQKLFEGEYYEEISVNESKEDGKIIINIFINNNTFNTTQTDLNELQTIVEFGIYKSILRLRDIDNNKAQGLTLPALENLYSNHYAEARSTYKYFKNLYGQGLLNIKKA